MLEYQFDKKPNREWVWSLLLLLFHKSLKSFLREVDLRKHELIEREARSWNLNKAWVCRFVKKTKGCHFNEKKISFLMRNQQIKHESINYWEIRRKKVENE